jgi:hypothetical protein
LGGSHWSGNGSSDTFHQTEGNSSSKGAIDYRLIEVKWSVYHAGEKKQLWGANLTATTLCLLIKGKVSIRFPMTECSLAREGDYVIWPAGLPHRGTIAEDALVLTIRWPSTAGDYEETTTE